MKKLILALAVMCLTGVVYANQQCFYGKHCVDGKIVKQERMERKTWMKMKACKCEKGEMGKQCKCAMMKGPMMKKKMMMNKDCKWAKKEGCPMMKGGKPCPHKDKMMKDKKHDCKAKKHTGCKHGDKKSIK